MAQLFIQVPAPAEIRFTDHLGDPMWDVEAVKDSNGEVLRNRDDSIVTKRSPAMRNFFAFLCELTLDPKFSEGLKTIEEIEVITEVRKTIQVARKEGALLVALDGDHVRRLQRVIKEGAISSMKSIVHNVLPWCQLVLNASEKNPTDAIASKPNGKKSANASA